MEIYHKLHGKVRKKIRLSAKAALIANMARGIRSFSNHRNRLKFEAVTGGLLEVARKH